MASETSSLLGRRDGPRLVGWDGEQDPQAPSNWDRNKKWSHVVSLALLTFIVPLGATMFAPAVSQAAAELGGRGATIAPLMLSIYVLGWTAGPILLAPISETRGRLPVYSWSSVLYIVFTMACAVSPNATSLIIFRFLAGSVGSTPLSLGAGTISDLIPVQQRGLALSMYMVGPILGPSIGPLVGGCLTDRWGWRSVFWALLALYGLAALVQMAVMRETYAPAILARKVNRLRAQSDGTHNGGWKSVLDEGLSSKEALARALVRPSKLTILSPINMFISIVSAYVNGLLFLVVATLPLVFGTEYHFGPRDVGFAFEGIGIGNIIGLAVFALTSDRYVRKRQREGSLKPEDRLLPVVTAGPMIAVGLFWYGWSAQQHAHWIVPIMGTALIGMGNILFFSAIISYLVDAFPAHAASAIAANIVIRSLGGTLLPLAGNHLYYALGWGWGSSLLGLVALLFTPGLLLLYTHGERFRVKYPLDL